MIAGILKEPKGEHRVSLLPEQAEALQQKNIEIWVEEGAGINAFAYDGAYRTKSIRIVPRKEILLQADMILSIHNLTEEEIAGLRNGTLLIGVYQPLYNAELMKVYATAMATVCSIDMLPRTTRAQSMDVLSSQANIAGYKAVLKAANLYGRYFPMFMTAAGSIAPAKVLVLGAGVAGLQAIATARRLGAIVEVFDTRPAVKEEVISLGAKFIEVEGAADTSTAGGYAVEQTEDYKLKQQLKIVDAIAKADIVITTAQIPGKKAPILITEEMITRMRNGSIIIDLAAATGGNTLFTKNNDTIQFSGVTIVGDSNLPSSMPYDASKLYGKNVLNFLSLLINKAGDIQLNFEDELIKGACITHGGEVVNERVK